MAKTTEISKKNYGFILCLNCQKPIKLLIKRDLTRKKFCSRTCSSTYYMKNGLSGMYGKKHNEETKEKISLKASLRVGRKNGNYKHGYSYTNLYQHWQSMKVRCRREYAGKGRTVCGEWQDFRNFEKWAIKNGFDEKLSLDRIDNSKGYYPENCQWIPMEINRIKDRKKHHVPQKD